MPARTDIRATVKAVLTAAGTRAGDRVDASRKTPVSQEPSALLGQGELSRIIVWTRGTKSRVFDESPRRYKHETEVVVEGLAQLDPDSNLDDDLDDFENEIVRALLVDDTLGGVVDDFQLVESLTDYGDAGNRMIGGVAITFTAYHYSTAPLPGTLVLPDLNAINTQYNLAGGQPDPADRAETIIEDLQL